MFHMQRAAHNSEVNCSPLSIVTTSGAPNLETQPVMKASAQLWASVFFSGIISGHLVDLSTIESI
jgi:hypothetical protein